MTNLTITYRNIDNLIPYANNSRTHNDEQVLQIANSIKEFGFTNPILIDEQGGVIAGHGRVLAGKKLGLKQVPTITLVGLTEAQKKAYVITDNKLALNADWDMDLLKIELNRLEEMDFDLSLTGFDDFELQQLENVIDNVSEMEQNVENSVDETKYLLLVEYDSEKQLEKAFDEAQRKGFKCKIIE